MQHPELRDVFAQHALAREFAPGIRFRFLPTMPEVPEERFDPDSGEDILDFVGRVWKPWLHYGFADVRTIMDVDRPAYDAIKWPKPYDPKSVEYDFEEFMWAEWYPLIYAGLVTRDVIRVRDRRLDDALTYRVRAKGMKAYRERGLNPDIVPPTFNDLLVRALDAPAIPESHRQRVAVFEINRAFRAPHP